MSDTTSTSFAKVGERSLDELRKLTYEEARARLVEIVSQLEQGSIPLEDSISLWETGEALARICRERLDAARERLDAVALDTSLADGADSRGQGA
ncbi:exodeoxyribonuclease VII small subunit [Arcanobacterium haemolyticum]|nr:exodeoxyribonuclease VII small subunit [Arcanobacterium haemolyticum]